MKDDDLGRAIAKMSAEYAQHLPHTVTQMEEIWRLALAAEAASPQLSQLGRMAHSIAGSGATFGLPGASRAAKELELLMERIGASGRPPGTAENETVTALLRAIRQAAVQA